MNLFMDMNIQRVSAGVIEENNMLWANCQMVEESITEINERGRIDIGFKVAKIKVNSDNDNRVASMLAESGLIPGIVTVEVKTIVKGKDASLEIVGFRTKKAA